MVRQTGNTVIGNKSWAQITSGSAAQRKLQQNKIQNNKTQKVQAPRADTQKLTQVTQFLEKATRPGRKFSSTVSYPISVSSSQLQAFQQEFQAICNLFNANSYYGKSTYAQKKAWIQTGGKSVISVASCFSLKHKPVPNLIRPQQRRAMKNKGNLKFVPRQQKNANANKGNKKAKRNSQPGWGESKVSSWGAEKAWGKVQPKQIREPPKEQLRMQQQMEKIQQRQKRQIELLNKAQLKQQELLLKKQTEQRKKLLQLQKQQRIRASISSQGSTARRSIRASITQKGKQQIRGGKPLRHRLEAVKKQNQRVVPDDFKYTLSQLVDAFNYFPKKSYRGDRAWKYNKYIGGFTSSASYFAARNAPKIPSTRPKVIVTNGLPVYTFNVKPISKCVITPYNSNLQGVRTEGNGKYFEHWHIGSIWTHYFTKPKTA